VVSAAEEVVVVADLVALAGVRSAAAARAAAGDLCATRRSNDRWILISMNSCKD
jgi:hypothetical protein